MKRREFLAGGSSALAAGSISVTVYPPSGGMIATIVVPVQSGFPAGGSWTFNEVGGGTGQTVTTLQPFSDPRGQFTQNRVQVTNSGLAGFRVIFARIAGGSWASVEMWHGDNSATAFNFTKGYTCTVSGDFTGSATTPYHWWGSRWRLSGNSTNGLRYGRHDWPVTSVTYAQLLADQLIPQFDPTQNAGSGTVSTLGPGPAAAYTPMGGSSWGTSYESVTPDMGVFSGYDCQYLASLSPTAGAPLIAMQPQLRQSVLDMAEAAGSLSWYTYDVAHGYQYERIVNHPGGTYQSPPGTSVDVTIVGPPGTYTMPNTGNNGGAGTSAVYYSPVQNEIFWFPVPFIFTIPSSGSVTVTCGGGMPFVYTEPPAGQIPSTDVYIAPGTDQAALQAMSYYWAPHSFVLGTPWDPYALVRSLKGYVPYLLWRDPWDLFSTQANPICPTPGGGDMTRWSQATVQQCIFDYRGAICAWRATRDTGEPNWVIPRSTLATWLNFLQNYWVTNAVNSSSPYTTVLHCLEAAGRSGNTRYDTICNQMPPLQEDQWIDPWANNQFAQSAALAVLLRPDANANAILGLVLKGIDDRFNGTSGWPNTIATLWHMVVRDHLAPLPSSMAQAWTASTPWVLTPYTPGADCQPQIPLPSTLVLASDDTYTVDDWAALSLGVQVGFTQYRSTRNYLRAACQTMGNIADIRAFKQV